MAGGAVAGCGGSSVWRWGAAGCLALATLIIVLQLSYSTYCVKKVLRKSAPRSCSQEHLFFRGWSCKVSTGFCKNEYYLVLQGLETRNLARNGLT